MTRANEHLDVLYCRGWDPGSRAMVGPLDLTTAAERAEADEDYAVLLLAGGRPAVLIETSRRNPPYVVWLFDRQLRRWACHELSLNHSGELEPSLKVEWRYSDPDQPEFASAAIRHETRYDGELCEVVRWPEGDHGDTTVEQELRSVEPRYPVPAFGDWTELASLGGSVSPHATVTTLDRVPDGLAVAPLDAPAQNYRTPLQPRFIAELFEDGARYTAPFSNGNREVSIEVRSAGELHLPTGRLLVTAPPRQEATLPMPFLAEVAPGNYPLSLSIVRFHDDPSHRRVAAVRIQVTDAPVARWELALRPGEDPTALGKDEFYGVDIDGGVVSFVDAAAVTAATAKVEETWPHISLDEIIAAAQMVEATGVEVEMSGPDWDIPPPELDEVVTLDLPTTDANLVTVASGWGDGSYPTWLGRTADGAVCCFVTDLLLLPAATFHRRRRSD